MLKSLSVSNFRNFEKEFIFDFSNIKNYEFNNICIQNNLANKVLIYGTNGCGKSNLGYAIFDIITNLTDHRKDASHSTGYLNAESKSDVAVFNYCFKFQNDIVEYEYAKKSIEEIIYEKLYINKKLIISYDRKNDAEATILLAGTETLNKDIKKSSISVIKYVIKNAVLIDDKQNKIFKKFSYFVEHMLFFRSLEVNDYIGFQSGSKDISDAIIEMGFVKEFEKFLNNTGIKCKLGTIESDGSTELAFVFKAKKLSFFNTCSTGTRSLALFFYWLKSFPKVSFLYMDEFDAFYHYSLSKSIIEEIKSTDCQTVITTHNTRLLTNDLLRPDCNFILTSNKICSISETTDKELRKAHNIEKIYIAGGFSE